MSYELPQPTPEQLRRGLHGLVISLAVVVMLRAVLQDEDRAVATCALVAVFVAVYLVRIRTANPLLRWAYLLAMVGVWAGLVGVGADAAYLSVGLFLVFLTELPLVTALAAVAAVAGLDVMFGLLRADWGFVDIVAPILGAVLSILIGLGFRVLFDAITSQRGLIEELRRTRAELADRERSAGQEAERQRLAREIHDTVAQGLSSIQLLLYAAEEAGLPVGAAERVALARSTAASGLAEARRLVAELAPADLADSSLADALQRVCDRAVVNARLQVDGHATALPMSVEAALVRIAQGALSNVERHAGAGANAVVTLGFGQDRVHLDVVDDGVGFDPTVLTDPAVPTFGLQTIRTRVAELGGQFAVESEPGHTAVSVSFAATGPEEDRS